MPLEAPQSAVVPPAGDPPLPSPSAAVASRAARTHRLLHGPIGPTLARLAAPNVIAMVVMAALNIAEGVFAGQLGVAALAGMALVFPLVMLSQMLAAGAMGGAISSAVARTLGAGEGERAGGLVLAAWAIAAAAAGLSAVAMALFGRDLFGLLGGGGAAIEAAALYAGVFFPGCFALWLFHASLSVMRGTGDMLTPSLLLFLAAAAAIPLGGALALGWGPFPALGMAGLATGPVTAYAGGAVVAIAYIALGRAGVSLAGAARRLNRGMFRDILKVGLIASLNAVQTVATIVLMVGLVGRNGAAALAGYGLGARLEFLMVPVVFGIGSALTAMVGANIGAGARPRALRVAWTGAFAAAALVGGIGAVMAVEPGLWLDRFLDADAVEARAAGVAYFHAVGPFYGFFAIGLALYFASQGAGRMIWPVMASFARMGVAFGGALAMLAWTDAGVVGVFQAIAAGMLTYGVLTAAAVRITRWR